MKEKLFAASLSAALLLATLTGCAAKPAADVPADPAPPSQNEPVVTPEAPESPAEPEVPAPSPEEPEPEDTVENPMTEPVRNPYRAALNRFAAVFSQDKDEFDDFPGSGGLHEVMEALGADAALQECGYLVEDLSGDGIPELLIGTSDSILALYTLRDGAPVHVFEGWYRNRYCLLADGRFYNAGSSSAASSGFGTFHLSRDALSIEWEDFYFTDYDYETEQMLWLHNTTGSWELSESERLSVSEDEFWQLSDALLADCRPLTLTSFADYIAAQPSPVTVVFVEDAVYDPENCTEFLADESEYSTKIVFTASEEVQDFRLQTVSFEALDDCGCPIFRENEVAHLGTLLPGEAVVVTLTFPGDLPSWGFSFVDAQNNLRRFTINTSGMDGSLFTEEY